MAAPTGTCHAGVPASSSPYDGVYKQPGELTWVLALANVVGFAFSFGIGEFSPGSRIKKMLVRR